MNYRVLIAACMAASTTALAAPSAGDEGGAKWFEAIIVASLRRLHQDSAADRVRYMACGYVAPELIQANEEALAKGDDSAFAAMLERLRAVLRPAGEGR